MGMAIVDVEAFVLSRSLAETVRGFWMGRGCTHSCLETLGYSYCFLTIKTMACRLTEPIATDN